MIYHESYNKAPLKVDFEEPLEESVRAQASKCYM